MLRGSFPAIDSGKDLVLILEVGRRQEAVADDSEATLSLWNCALRHGQAQAAELSGEETHREVDQRERWTIGHPVPVGCGN